MVMTKSQWDKLQKRLPAEDRVSYADYLASQGATNPPVSPIAQRESGTIGAVSIATQQKAMAAEAVTPTPTPMDITSQRYTAAAQAAGLTPTPTATTSTAPKAVTETSRQDNGDGTFTVYYSDGTSKVVGTKVTNNKRVQQLPEGFTAGPFPTELQQFFGAPGDILGYRINTETDKSGKTFYTLSVANRGGYGEGVTGFSTFGARFTRDASGKYVLFSSSDAVTQSTTGNITTGSNAELLSIIQSLQNTIANLSSKPAVDAAAEKAARDLEARQSAFDLLYSEMDAIGLAALVEPLRGLIQKGVSPSEFAVELRQSEAYKARFIANDSRLKKGLRVLSPREYLAVEDAYRQTLRTYGLRQFDNDEYVRQFIENDISAAELSDRVSMAVQRVQNADPAISRTLRDYYGIGQNDLVAYVLDPNQQLQKIQRQIAAAEIGTAARVQGLEAGVGVSEQLAAQGISQAQAQKGYATIADILPTAEKLSQIYGATMEGYDQAQAEQEVFNQLASAQRRRERLTQREIAAFSGASGLGRTSLAGESRGQF